MKSMVVTSEILHSDYGTFVIVIMVQMLWLIDLSKKHRFGQNLKLTSFIFYWDDMHN